MDLCQSLPLTAAFFYHGQKYLIRLSSGLYIEGVYAPDFYIICGICPCFLFNLWHMPLVPRCNTRLSICVLIIYNLSDLLRKSFCKGNCSFFLWHSAKEKETSLKRPGHWLKVDNYYGVRYLDIVSIYYCKNIL